MKASDSRLRSRKATAVAAVLAGSVAVQLSASLAAGLFRTFAPTNLGAMRIMVVGVVLLLLVRPRPRSVREVSPAALGVGLAVSAQAMFHYEAISRIPLASAVAIGLIGPIAVAVITSRRWLDVGLVVVVAGGLFLLLGSPRLSSVSGVLFELAAAASTILYLAMILRLGKESIRLDGLAIGLAAAAVALTPLSVSGFLRTPNLPTGGKLLAIGALSTAPYAAELSATRVLPVGIVGLLICADPIAAAVFAFLVLDQGLTLRESVGILCVTAAAALAVGLAPEVHRARA
jgi:inner membrane transporter RhtA